MEVKRKYEFKKDKKWKKIKLLLVAVFAISIISTGVYMLFNDNTTHENVTKDARTLETDDYLITTVETNIYKEPNTSSEVLYAAKEEEILDYIIKKEYKDEDENIYYYVSLYDENEEIIMGYVLQNDVKTNKKEEIVATTEEEPIKEIIEKTIEIEVDQEYKLNPDNLELNIELNEENKIEDVISLSEDGIIKGKKAGECTLTYSLDGDPIKATIKVKEKKEVKPVVKKITVAKENVYLFNGEQEQIVINNSTNVTGYKFKSSNPSIATVSSKGVIKALIDEKKAINGRVVISIYENTTLLKQINVTVGSIGGRIYDYVDDNTAHRVAYGNKANGSYNPSYTKKDTLIKNNNFSAEIYQVNRYTTSVLNKKSNELTHTDTLNDRMNFYVSKIYVKNAYNQLGHKMTNNTFAIPSKILENNNIIAKNKANMYFVGFNASPIVNCGGTIDTKNKTIDCDWGHGYYLVNRNWNFKVQSPYYFYNNEAKTLLNNFPPNDFGDYSYTRKKDRSKIYNIVKAKSGNDYLIQNRYIFFLTKDNEMKGYFFSKKVFKNNEQYESKIRLTITDISKGNVYDAWFKDAANYKKENPSKLIVGSNKSYNKSMEKEFSTYNIKDSFSSSVVFLYNKNGEKIKHIGSANGYKERNQRQAICQIDKNNYVLISEPDPKNPKIETGFTYNEISAYMDALGCKMAANLDGGGSTALIVGNGSSKAVKNYVPSARDNGEVFYFHN